MEGQTKPVKKLKFESIKNLTSCPYCFCYYARRKLWHHKRKCPDNDGRPVQLSTEMIFGTNRNKNSDLFTKVFPRMHVNNMANKVAKNDALYYTYSGIFLKTHRQEYQIPVGSRKMR